MRFRSQTIFVLALGMLIGFGPAALAQNNIAGNASGAPSANTPQVAQPDQGGVNWKGVGVGAGTVAGNILYVPAKLVYGILGGIAGGAGYALTGGNKQVSDTIWRSSLGGDYVLTPNMVTGKEPVHFSGPTQTAPSAASGGGDPTGSGLALARSGSGSAAPASSLSSSAIPPAQAGPGAHPIDLGAGPVGNTTPVRKTAPAPDNGGIE
ncbi:MAG: hypothetical protein ACREQC_11885 [Candidatus Binataceae bacterium]